MAKADWEGMMRQRIQDMSRDITVMRRHRDSMADDRCRIDATARLQDMEWHRDQMLEQLEEMEGQSDTLWDRFKLRIDLEWFDLVQDMEERLNHLDGAIT